MVMLKHVVIVGPQDRRGAELVDVFRRHSETLHVLSTDGIEEAERLAVELDGLPVSLLLCLNSDHPPVDLAADVSRQEMARGLWTFSFLPFHVATLLRPNLTMALGRAVLLTDPAAVMTHVDQDGACRERPFRAAAHSLWRCLSVEWAQFEIACPLIALPGDGPLDLLPDLVQSAPNGEMVDLSGTKVGW